MKSSLQRWTARVPDISAVLARFPFAVTLMAMFTLILLVIGIDGLDNRDHIGRLCLGLILAGYVSVSMTLAREGQGKAPIIMAQVAASVVICALAWVSDGLRLNLIMAIGAVILLLGNAVRWRRGRDDLHVWDFTHKLWTGVAFATLGSIIFLLGLLFITTALKTLFGLDIEGLMKDVLLPIGFGFLAPLYWLSTLPPANEDYAELYDNPGFVSKAVAFLGTWLLAPLTLIYALILLAYGVKIGLSMSLPKGEIAALTLPFLIIGTLTWLVLDPPFIREKALAKLFRRAWWPLSIPAAVLLGIAVFVRIREYGYTPQRFALTIGVTWAFVMGLWFSLGPKAKRDIRLIPGSAAALLLLGTFGAGWLSVANQEMRLEQNLVKAGIMSADGMVADAVTITDKDSARKAKGALIYLWKNEGKARIAKVLSATNISITPSPIDADATHPEKEHLATIETALGLDKIAQPGRWMREDEINYFTNSREMDVARFDSVYGPVNLYLNDSDTDVIKTGDIEVRLQNGVLTITLRTGETATFNAIQWIDAQGLDYGRTEGEPLRVELLSAEARAVTLHITNFNSWTEINNDETPTRRLNLDVYILTQGSND